MANSRSNDWSDRHPGGRFTVFEGTARGHTGHEPPYYLNGYEHEGYEEQPCPRESDELEELAHDDGYLPRWGAGRAYLDAEPYHPSAETDYTGRGYLPPAHPGDTPDTAANPWVTPDPDPWDMQDSGYIFPVAWRWQDPAAPSRRGRGESRASRPPRALWMAAIGAVGLVATVLVFRWVGEAPPVTAPAARTHSAAATAGAMPAAGMATPSYGLIAAKQADGFGYNATASRRRATKLDSMAPARVRRRPVTASRSPRRSFC